MYFDFFEMFPNKYWKKPLYKKGSQICMYNVLANHGLWVMFDVGGRDYSGLSVFFSFCKH